MQALDLSFANSDVVVGNVPNYYAQLEPSKIALYDGKKSITYGELNNQVDILASALITLGVKPGDIVSAYLPNCIEYVLVVLSVARAGAIFSPINPRYKRVEISEILQQSKPNVIFTNVELVNNIKEVLSGWTDKKPITIEIDGQDADGTISLEKLFTVDKIKIPACSENQFFSLMFTSGTTGKPKGALATHKARMIWVMNAAIQYGLNSQDIYLGTMPQVHSAGLTFTLMHLYVGATVRIMPHFDAEEFIKIVEAEGITSSLTVPTILTMLVEQLEKNKHDLTATKLKRVVTCGSPLPVNTKMRVLDKISRQLFDYYGSTESNSMSVLRPEDQLRKPESVGQAFRGVKLKVMNIHNVECSAGEVGEVWCMNPSVMTEYLNRPKETMEAFTDRWYHTGDYGFLDEEGYLHLAGRLNDVIISGGVNIYPAEIEQVLMSHPNILDAAVVGVDDPKWGQAVKAYLVTRGHVKIEIDEIQAFCEKQIAAFKKPRYVEFRNLLPKNAGGKTVKAELTGVQNV
jgi:acyl-CoA synthetase (AMP-forming)/AMP-acid ligase II